MKVGLNLSFAVKRWLEPEVLASMVKKDLKTEYVQFTWDLIDPWWPAQKRDALARKWSQAFKKEGLVLTGTFGGLASYTYPQLMAPEADQREISFDFLKRAVDMTAVMEADYMGTPLGGMSNQDAFDKKRREYIYQTVLDYVRKLTGYAKKMGLKKILVEPTPLATEFPGDPQSSLKLMNDLEGTTDLPVLLLLDWGHVLYKPLLKKEADMDKWLESCLPYLDSFHLQQTDGLLDRHWSFTHEGIVTLELIKNTVEKHNINELVQYVEVIYPFEETDSNVYQDIKRTMDILHNFSE